MTEARFRWLWCAFALASCAPSDRLEPVAELRQAFGSAPDLVGTLDAGALGSSLAACPGGGFVAGAPGAGSALLTDDGSVVGPGPNGLGKAVACEGNAAAQVVYAAGPPGLAAAQGGGWLAITSSPTVALARSDLLFLPLLVSEANGTVRFFDTSTGLEVAAPLIRAPGFGASLAWFPQSRRFAVGDPDAGLAQVFDLDADGGVTLVAQFQDPAIPGFGRSVAAGDLSPRPGLELVVASRGRVSTFQLDGGLVFRIAGVTNTLGAALAISPGYALGLDSLWVGEPATGKVTHYVGDAGTSTSRTGMAFGTSIAVDDRRVVAVGAPGFPGGDAGLGALFFEQRGGPVAGVVMECTVGVRCATTTCAQGDCLGGVLCMNTIPQCSAAETCDTSAGMCVRDGGVDAGTDAGVQVDAGQVDGGEVDAGEVDAGEVDAGEVDAGEADAGEVDAGEVDAGEVDAGEVDAGVEEGPMIFGTCGCSADATLPSLLLGLTLLRWRVRRPGD